MRQAQDVIFDVEGQVVYHDATDGIPASVTSVEVFSWDASDDSDSESALDSPSTEVTYPFISLTAAAGPSQANPRLVTVGSTTGLVVGRVFVIRSSSGLQESVEIESIPSATTFTARHPLHNDFSTDAAIYSLRIQATIDPSWVADDGNLVDAGANPHYRVRWVYSLLSGETRVADSYFNLVRYPGTTGVQPQDIESLVPGWLDSLPTDHRASQGRTLIADAYREVRLDLHQVDTSASSLAEAEVIDDLVRYKTIELGEWAKFYKNSDDVSRADAATKRYTARLDALVRVVNRVPVRDTTGAAAPTVSVGLSRR